MHVTALLIMYNQSNYWTDYTSITTVSSMHTTKTSMKTNYHI